jgi:hypothetical protein
MSTNEFIKIIRTKGCASVSDIQHLSEGFHSAESVGAAKRVINKCGKCGKTCRVRAEVTNTAF